MKYTRVPVIGSKSFYPFILLFISCMMAASCGLIQGQKEEPVADSLHRIVLKSGTPIPNQQRAYYQQVCTAWFDSSLGRTGFNGGMVIAKNGQILFEKYMGSEALDGKVPNTDSTSFHIASVSKTFTAMAVLLLMQEGKLQLDDLFSKYFPQFNYPDVTIRTLLNHRSGLPNYVYFMEKQGWDKQQFVQNKDVLDFLVRYHDVLENIAPANRHFTYCNTNYALLALLIEKLSGQSYSDFLTQHIFRPLGMRHTFVFDSTRRASATASFDWRGRVIPLNYLDLVYGDKNIYSTPRDLLQWDQLLYTQELFTDATKEAAFTPYSNEKAGNRNYGLGWRMFLFPEGKKIIYHNGWWHGNNASLIRFVADSATVIILGNRFNRHIYHGRDLAVLFKGYGAAQADEEGSADSSMNPDIQQAGSQKSSALQSSKPKSVQKILSRRKVVGHAGAIKKKPIHPKKR